MRTTAKWLLLPLALLCATAVAAPQLLFLGYDLRGLAERDLVYPFGAVRSELPYVLEESPEWLAAGGRLYPADADFRLGYEIDELIAS